MRLIPIAVFCMSLSACSFLAGSAPNAVRTLDPTKIYLTPPEQITVTRREVDRYACIAGPMLCTAHGVSVDCTCGPY